MQRFQDKIVIITGSGQGIGRAAARRIAAEGGTVIIADAHQGAAERTLSDMRATGAKADMFVGDIADYDTAKKLIDGTIAKFGKVDSLVNNIGGATALKPYTQWTPKEIVDEINLSLLAPLWCCHAVLPHMIQRRYGRIVNVGAESARNGLWDRAPYNVGKGGVMALTTSIARENAEYGITCNCLSPGPTDTEHDRIISRGERVKAGAESENLKRLSKMVLDIVPMARRATSDEQAAAIAFLASDDVGHITGQTVSAGGGMNML